MLEYFQIFLGLWITYALSTMITTFILMSWNSSRKIKILVKSLFCFFQLEPHDMKFTTKLFHKRNVFPFHINHMPYLNSSIPLEIYYATISSEILRNNRTTTDLINMVICVNLLLIRMKKQSSECTRIISLLKEIFAKHFKVFHKLADIADKFIKLFSLHVYFYVSMYVYMCILYV